MIAIAISCDPRLLIADEPTTALDVTVQAQVLDLLADLRAEHGMAMILITHDMGVVAEVADDVAVMYAGQIVESAAVTELFDRPEHPYTQALLGALPPLDGTGVRDARLTAIPGRPPDLIDPPAGCRFAPRCPYAGSDDGARASRRSCARSGAATWCARRTRPASAPPRRPGGVARDAATRCSRCATCASTSRCAAAASCPRAAAGFARGRRRLVRHRRPARRSASWASPAAASPRRARCSCGCWSRPRAARVRGPGSHALGRVAAPAACAADADRLPGPLLVAQPAHDRRRLVGEPLGGHGVGTALATAARRSQELLDGVGLDPSYVRPLSARVLGRPAPAHRHRPRARARARG